MDYFNAIKKHYDRKNFNPKDILKIIFILGNVAKTDAPLDAEKAAKYGLSKGETVPIGSCPVKERIRTETFLLTVAMPFALKAFAQEKTPLNCALLVCDNDDLFQNIDGNCFINKPIICEPRGNVREAWQDAAAFADNWREQENNPDYNFNLKKYFNITVTKGALPVDKHSLIFAGVDPAGFELKVKTLRALIAAEEAGATVLDNPYYRIGEFAYKRHGFGDAKAMVKTLIPEFYPPSCEGRDEKEALAFAETCQDVVIKPSNASNGVGVSFFDLRETNEAAKEKKRADFKKIFRTYVETHAYPCRIIVQKNLRGVSEHGETRIFIYDKKILPVGIRLTPNSDEALCKIFMNATCEPVLLSEEYLRLGIKFIKAAKDVKLKYFGLDVIKDKDENGSDKLFMTEANTIISGFFDKIAVFIDRNIQTVLERTNALPDSIRPYISDGYMNVTVYKQLYDHLLKTYQFHIPDVEILADALAEASEIYKPLSVKSADFASVLTNASKTKN